MHTLYCEDTYKLLLSINLSSSFQEESDCTYSISMHLINGGQPAPNAGSNQRCTVLPTESAWSPTLKATQIIHNNYTCP